MRFTASFPYCGPRLLGRSAAGKSRQHTAYHSKGYPTKPAETREDVLNIRDPPPSVEHRRNGQPAPYYVSTALPNRAPRCQHQRAWCRHKRHGEDLSSRRSAATRSQEPFEFSNIAEKATLSPNCPSPIFS